MASTIRNTVIQMGPVTIPVALRSASDRQDITFSKATTDGTKIRQVLVRESEAVPGEQATILTPEEIERGVWDGNQFFQIDEDEITAINEACARPHLEIEEFVDLDEVPWERVTGFYYLIPQTNMLSLKALKLLHDALAQTGKAGIVRLMPKSRVKLAVVYAKHGGVMLSSLAYTETFKQVEEGAASLEGAPEMKPEALELAMTFMEKMSAPQGEALAALAAYRDDQVDQKAELVEQAKQGESLTAAEPKAARVAPSEDALEESLRESIKQIRASKKPGKASPRTTSKKRRAAVKQ